MAHRFESSKILKDSVRKRLLYLLGKAYKNVQMQDAVQYFGLPENALIPGKKSESKLKNAWIKWSLTYVKKSVGGRRMGIQ